MWVRVLIYCRRAAELALLQRDGARLAQYAAQQQYQVSSVLLELDAGIWAERLGIYEVRRQMQAGWAEAVLLRDLAALGSTEAVQQRALSLLGDYTILFADIDSF